MFEFKDKSKRAYYMLYLFESTKVNLKLNIF